MKNVDEKINVVIVGHGKLAKAILSYLPELDKNNGYVNNIQNYDDLANSSAKTILIHVGSGRQYRECLELALKQQYGFIQAATIKDIAMEPPSPESIVYIHAPNLDLHLIKLFYWLKLGSKLFRNEEITIKESHQASKKSVPGTANKICDILGIDHAKIESIRDLAVQRKLQIKTLEQHAYHELVIGNSVSQIKIETKIEGIFSYVEGLYEILKTIHKIPMNNYEIEELIQNEYI